MKTITLILVMVLFCNYGKAQVVPYTFTNTSTYADDQIYVAIVGITAGHVWIDCKTGAVNPMNVADNTISGPLLMGIQVLVVMVNTQTVLQN